MSTTLGLALPPAFPLVGLGVVSLTFLNYFQQYIVTKARKESSVSYPTLYATEAETKADPKKLKYNCAQRQHQNTLENIPYILAQLFYYGFFHPRAATAFTLIWAFGRIFYSINYAAGNPKERNAGIAKVAYIGLFGLFFGSIYTAVSQIKPLYF